jgi:hypothetical protein
VRVVPNKRARLDNDTVFYIAVVTNHWTNGDPVEFVFHSDCRFTVSSCETATESGVRTDDCVLDRSLWANLNMTGNNAVTDVAEWGNGYIISNTGGR